MRVCACMRVVVGGGEWGGLRVECACVCAQKKKIPPTSRTCNEEIKVIRTGPTFLDLRATTELASICPFNSSNGLFPASNTRHQPVFQPDISAISPTLHPINQSITAHKNQLKQNHATVTWTYSAWKENKTRTKPGDENQD